MPCINGMGCACGTKGPARRPNSWESSAETSVEEERPAEEEESLPAPWSHGIPLLSPACADSAPAAAAAAALELSEASEVESSSEVDDVTTAVEEDELSSLVAWVETADAGSNAWFADARFAEPHAGRLRENKALKTKHSETATKLGEICEDAAMVCGFLHSARERLARRSEMHHLRESRCAATRATAACVLDVDDTFGHIGRAMRTNGI